MTTVHLPEIVGGVVVLLSVSLFVKDVSEKNVWRLTSSAKKQKENSAYRGMLVSALNSLIVVAIVFALEHFSTVDKTTLQTTVGLVWGNSLGFIMDNMMATESSLKTLKERGISRSFKEAISLLQSRQYSRYLMIDMIVISISISMLPHVAQLFKNTFKSDFMQKFSMSASQITITTLLFLAFTNDARFNWAYVDSESENSKNPKTALYIIVSIICGIQMVNKASISPGEGILSINSSVVMMLIIIALCIRESLGVTLPKKFEWGLMLFALLTVASFTVASKQKWSGFLIGILIFIPFSALYSRKLVIHAFAFIAVCLVLRQRHLARKLARVET